MADRKLDGQKLRIGLLTSIQVEKETAEAKDVVDILHSYLNFTYDLYYSTPSSNGSINYLFQLLKEKKIDVIASRVPFIPSLAQIFDLSRPLGQEEWVVFQQNPSDTYSINGIFKPFTPMVWFVVFLSVIGMIPVMLFLYRLYARIMAFRNDIDKYNGRLDDYAMFVVYSLLRQNHTLHHLNRSQVILMITWWMAGLVLTTFYTAELTSTLASYEQVSIVKNPMELRSSTGPYSNTKWLTLQGASLHMLTVDNSTDKAAMYTALDKQLANGRGKVIDSVSEAAGLVADKGYVWFGAYEMLLDVVIDDYMNNKMANKSKVLCPFCLSDKNQDKYLTVDYGLAFYKNSSLTPVFNKVLTRISESGILQRMKTKGKNPCALKTGYKENQNAKVSDFIGLLYTYLVCTTIAIIAFVGEKVVAKRNSLVRQQQQQQLQDDNDNAWPKAASRDILVYTSWLIKERRKYVT